MGIDDAQAVAYKMPLLKPFKSCAYYLWISFCQTEAWTLHDRECYSAELNSQHPIKPTQNPASNRPGSNIVAI